MRPCVTGFVAGLLLLFPVSAGLAQGDWPEPPANWWTQLKGGEKATFVVEMSGNMAMGEMRMTQTVVSVTGSSITLSTEMQMGGMALPGQTSTVDGQTFNRDNWASLAKPQPMGGRGAPQMPPRPQGELVVTKGESASLEVGGKPFPCTWWHIQPYDVKSCHNPQIPPVFSGGAVMSEINSQGMAMKFRLVSYEGTLLK